MLRPPKLKLKAKLLTRTALHAAAFSLLLLAFFSRALPGNPAQTPNAQRVMNWTGEIMDSQCSTEGSHDAMMAKTGAKTAQECVQLCVKNGSYVLFDADKNLVYQLDDQKKPVPFAGRRVRISGTYDEPSRTITIQSIEAAPKAAVKPASGA